MLSTNKFGSNNIERSVSLPFFRNDRDEIT